MPDQPGFTAHNIRLDDGSLTRPGQDWLTADDEWCRAALRTLRVLYPQGGAGRRIVDLGCLEGGFAVEFARMGFETLGLEVRESNFANCARVKAGLDLPNLTFVRDDAWNLARYGRFDVVFCCGLLYHIERPVAFIHTLADLSGRALILNTHFAADAPNAVQALGELTEHEGAQGRWFTEYDPAVVTDEAALDQLKWASWSNHRAFWLRREAIFDTLRDAHFDLVYEQMDCISGSIAASMQSGYYRDAQRGMFVGIRTGVSPAS
jgi:SAM-dependent methyltransferase